jgi:pimeloyl-ACP methyl ester carboxylesterase
MKPTVETLVRKQTRLINDMVSDAETILSKEEGDEFEAGIKLLAARRGAPKNKRLMKVLKEPGVGKLISDVESAFMRDKKLHEIDDRLYYFIDEREHSIALTDLGQSQLTKDEQLLFEEINNIHQMGTYLFLAKLIAPLTTKNIQQMDFWLPLAGFDPLPYWEVVGVPAFAAFGGGDINLPVAESIQRLESLEKEIRYEEYPEGGHGITDPKTGEVQMEFLNDLVDFIQATN